MKQALRANPTSGGGRNEERHGDRNAEPAEGFEVDTPWWNWNDQANPDAPLARNCESAEVDVAWDRPNPALATAANCPARAQKLIPRNPTEIARLESERVLG